MNEPFVTRLEGARRQTLRSHYRWWCEKNSGRHWRFKRLSFAYFSLPLQRKVGAAPHRGNPGRPPRKQKTKKQEQKRHPLMTNHPRPPSRPLDPVRRRTRKPSAAPRTTTASRTMPQRSTLTRLPRRMCRPLINCMGAAPRTPHQGKRRRTNHSPTLAPANRTRTRLLTIRDAPHDRKRPATPTLEIVDRHDILSCLHSFKPSQDRANKANPLHPECTERALRHSAECQSRKSA